MAIKDSSYESSFMIPTPKGVYQADGDTNVSVNYAYRAENMRTERGLLATSYGTSRAFPALGHAIETLTRFYRRNKPDDPEVFVACANGAIYTYTLGAAGWSKRSEGYASNRWSYATYETTEGGGTVDVLLMTNEKDGMVAVYGSDLRVEKKKLTIGDDYGEVKFAVLGRYMERLWGTGAPGYPDSVFYSRAYDPFNWTVDAEAPELGGGVINQPSWDGDSFVSLEPFGGYLLAAKNRTVYEIRGSDPSTFTITLACGTEGPVQARTACVDGQAMYFLTQGGLGRYDGANTALLARDVLYETMRMMAKGKQENATACVCNHVYYLAMCIKENEYDEIAENNTVIEFDIERGTFMVRKGIRVKDFFALDGIVYYTQAGSPHEVLRYNDPDSGSYLGQPMESLWETAWLDLGKAYKKQDFVLRFTAEADADDVPVELSLITNRKEKTKTILLSKARKDYKVKLQNKGVRVKLRIRSGQASAGWRIYGGVQVEYTVEEE